MDFVGFLAYLEKHVSWRNVACLLLVIGSFAAGYYYCSAKRDKEDALIINQHTKDIKMYVDSANSTRDRSRAMEIEYKILLWRKDKTIDSLQTIITNFGKEVKYENEQ